MSNPVRTLTVILLVVLIAASVVNAQAPDSKSAITLNDLTIQTLEIASIGLEDAWQNGDATPLAMSNDGRYVLFSSWASNLVEGITPDANPQLFLRDCISNTTECISITPGGDLFAYGAYSSRIDLQVRISADGRYVAMITPESLVAEDTNGEDDVYRYDRQTDTWTCATLTSMGVAADSFSFRMDLSPNGGYVAVASYATNMVPGDTNGKADIFLCGVDTGTVELVSVDADGELADGHSYTPVISNGGQYVAFVTSATDLVPGDTNGVYDVMLRDTVNDTTTRISVGPGGIETDDKSGVDSAAALKYGLDISDDGRYVAYISLATNLTSTADTNPLADAFVYDRTTGLNTLASVSTAGVASTALSNDLSISGDGSWVIFGTLASLDAADIDDHYDVYMHSMETGETIYLEVGEYGVEPNGTMSFSIIDGTGEHVSFGSTADNLLAENTGRNEENPYGIVYLAVIGQPLPTPTPTNTATAAATATTATTATTAATSTAAATSTVAASPVPTTAPTATPSSLCFVPLIMR